jgi:hypothetical protein
LSETNQESFSSKEKRKRKLPKPYSIADPGTGTYLLPECQAGLLPTALPPEAVSNLLVKRHMELW